MATHSSPRSPRHLTVAFMATGLVFSLVVAAPAAEADSTLDPSIEAQQLIYEVNLARWNPPAFAAIAGDDVVLPEGMLARPPQAVNVDLGESSMFKANELSDYHYWAHQSAVTGVWPNELARSFGYPLPSWWIDDANYIESLHVGSDDPIRVLASFAKSPGHRAHVFGEGGWSAWNEIGVGRSTSENYWAIQSAYREPTRTFVTGVVYEDLDEDGRMDMGEGVAGATVRIGAVSVITNAGGGYAVQRGPGTYSASTAGGGSATVVVGSYNVGVDFIVGSDRPIVRAYELCNGEAPTMLGTSGDDILYATAGRDVIHGLGGDDIAVGTGPDDVVCSAVTSATERLSGATERLSGPDRFATAAAISQDTHPQGSAVVFVAVGTNYPDAIAAGPAAAARNAPILLVHEDSLPSVTAHELQRLDPDVVVVLGGPVAIADEVVRDIGATLPGSQVERHYGGDRFATAAEISRRTFPANVDTVYVVSGLDFATALSAAPAAIADGSPLLLVPPTGLPATVATELDRLSPNQIIVVGGTAKIPDAVVSALAAHGGSITRIDTTSGYDAAVSVSRSKFQAGVPTVYIAVGDAFPDALAGGAATGLSPGPILLVTSNDVPPAVAIELQRLRPSHIVIFGGSAAVSDLVENELAGYVSGS